MLLYMKEGLHCLPASASYFALQGHCCANRKYWSLMKVIIDFNWNVFFCWCNSLFQLLLLWTSTRTEPFTMSWTVPNFLMSQLSLLRMFFIYLIIRFVTPKVCAFFYQSQTQYNFKFGQNHCNGFRRGKLIVIIIFNQLLFILSVLGCWIWWSTKLTSKSFIDFLLTRSRGRTNKLAIGSASSWGEAIF